jgi:hypothetical protein
MSLGAGSSTSITGCVAESDGDRSAPKEDGVRRCSNDFKWGRTILTGGVELTVVERRPVLLLIAPRFHRLWRPDGSLRRRGLRQMPFAEMLSKPGVVRRQVAHHHGGFRSGVL